MGHGFCAATAARSQACQSHGDIDCDRVGARIGYISRVCGSRYCVRTPVCRAAPESAVDISPNDLCAWSDVVEARSKRIALRKLKCEARESSTVFMTSNDSVCRTQLCGPTTLHKECLTFKPLKKSLTGSWSPPYMPGRKFIHCHFIATFRTLCLGRTST